MKAARRAMRALTFALCALALAGPAHAGAGTQEASRETAAAASPPDEATGPVEALARLGPAPLGSDGPDSAGGGVRALRSELARLRLENEALRADVRSSDRLVGAGLLAGGMLLGALLRAAAGRRPQPRIRF